MMEEHRLPKFDYYLDESDPDVLILCRQDGAYVAPFSASGATRNGIVEAAKEDYGQLSEADAASNRARSLPRDSGANRAVNPGTRLIHPSA
jgi:hypothetical protein